MKKLLRNMAVALTGVLFAASVFAQTYPYTNPTYIPQGISPATTYTSTGVTTAYQVNGVVTLNIGVYGAPVGLVAVVQGTESRDAATATWQNLPVDSVDGDRYSQITSTGLYRINTSGLAQIRVNITSLSSGSVTISQSGGVGPLVSGKYNINKHTYHAAVFGLVPAASATDLFTITGSSTTTVRITHVECSGQSVGGSQVIRLQQRTTPDSGGTASSIPSVPSDQSDPAGTATVVAYTANPTVGTATSGVARAGVIDLPSAVSAVGNHTLSWDFGAQSRSTVKEIVLRNVSQVLAVSGGGATFPTTSTLNCALEWTED